MSSIVKIVEYVHTQVPATCVYIFHGKRDFVDVNDVKGLKIGRFSWLTEGPKLIRGALKRRELWLEEVREIGRMRGTR